MPISGETWPQPRSSLRGFSRSEQRNFPELRAGIGIESVGRVVLGHDEHHVVRDAPDGQLRQVQWLGIHASVHGEIAQQAEGCRFYVCLGQRVSVVFWPVLAMSL